jgi:choline dehydrogenase
MKKNERKKEFIVIGGGTAGILATYRLIELGYKVTLIDLRSENRSTQSESNVVWSQLCNDSSITQSVLTEPQSHLYQRSIKYVFGRSLGGTSNINASLHHLGDLEVFNKYWPESWNSKVLRSYETILDSIIPSEVIGSSGLLQEIIESSSSKEIYRSLLEPHNNKRWNHSALLKKEWITDGSLRIIEGKVKKILFQAKKATHILLESSQLIIVPADSEVILTAGVFGTPEILANSGILSVHQNSNNPNERRLQKVDIGENLQDHCLLGTVFFGSWKSHWKTTVPYPGNCVHGIIPLNRTNDGDHDTSTIPARFFMQKF